MFFNVYLSATAASASLGFGINRILKSDFTPELLALDFAITLFFTLMTLYAIKKLDFAPLWKPLWFLGRFLF